MSTSLTTAQSQRLAQFRVKKGVAWLNCQAPRGWQWNAFAMMPGGTVYFRARDRYDNECVLALAFMYQASLANTYGYVTFAAVARAMRLDQHFLTTHGFQATQGVPTHILDNAWNEALTTYAAVPSVAYRHETALDRKFAENLQTHSWWKYLRRRVA